LKLLNFSVDPKYIFHYLIKTQSSYSGGNLGNFHVFRDELYYTDKFCDTLYLIEDFILKPKYIFNTDGHTLPYQTQDGVPRYNFVESVMRGKDLTDQWKQYFVLERILENSKNLYITFDFQTKKYPVIYNKKEDILQIMPPISIPLPYRDFVIPPYGFENDLDGGLMFWPLQMISDKEMMCVFSAEDLLGLDVLKIIDEKLKKLLNNLKEDSNPVVAIVTLKD